MDFLYHGLRLHLGLFQRMQFKGGEGDDAGHGGQDGSISRDGTGTIQEDPVIPEHQLQRAGVRPDMV